MRPRTHATWLPAAAIALALAIPLSGCGLFSTRPPDPPNTGGGPPTNFSLPESTLASFARAVHFRSPSNYGLCLADTTVEQREFHAAFDPADITAYVQSGGTAPTDWKRANELSFFPQFVAYLPNAAYDVYFSVDTDRGGIVNVGGPTNKQIYNLHYRVWSGATNVCAGAAGITMERIGGSGEFKMTYWEDRRDTSGVRTWGAARLNGR
jgi:hypothetical protein